ncbi:hypothetical protein BD770DRAFT_110369 [Pilaira anomala]|nr:hypothetical protein BD770DRAFT_110369 [Pilaira anomala]
MYSCDQCEKTFVETSKRRLQVFNFHQKVAEVTLNGVDCQIHMDAQTMYTCAICSNNCTGYQSMQKHFKRVHTQYELKNTKRRAEEFTFSEECAEVLLSKRIKSGLLADGLDTVHSKITLKNDNNEFNFFSLLNKTSMGVLRNLGLLNKSISCTIKAHKEENLKNETTLSYLHHFYL